MIGCAPRRHRRGDSHAGVVLAVAALATFAGCLPAAAADVVYVGWVQAATGEYVFTESTTSVLFINAIEVSAGRVHLLATCPFISQSTSWITYSEMLIPTGGAQHAAVGQEIERRGRGTGRTDRDIVISMPTETAVRQTGIGDPTFRVTTDLANAGSAVQFNVSAAVKAPIAAADSGLGTGEWDYGAGIGVSRQKGSGQVFGTFEFWVFGDMPDLELKDAAAYQVGYERFVHGDRWSLLASISGWTPVVDGFSAPVSVNVGLTNHLSASRSVGLVAAVGLTDTAPDFLLSIDWRLPF